MACSKLSAYLNRRCCMLPPKPPLSSHACRSRPKRRPPVPAGFTKSSMMASGSWRARDPAACGLLTRNGHDFAARLPLGDRRPCVAHARSCLIDGEAIALRRQRAGSFPTASNWRWHGPNFVFAPSTCLNWTAKIFAKTQSRTAAWLLAKLLDKAPPNIALNDHFPQDGSIVFKHACALGGEGIVSKRLGSPYRSGRSDAWIKVKNPESPAVKREAEEDCTSCRKSSSV